MRNRFVEVRTWYDSNTSTTQALVKDYSGVIFPALKYLKIYVPKSTIGVVDTLKGQPSDLMTCSEILIHNTNYVNKYCHKIISNINLEESSTWYFHVMTFVALSVRKVKATLNLRLVVKFPA